MIEHIELTEAYEATPGALADLAAEAIRALNHATAFPGQGRLTHPGDVSEVLGSLRQLAERLPQALAQLHTFIGDELAVLPRLPGHPSTRHRQNLEGPPMRLILSSDAGDTLGVIEFDDADWPALLSHHPEGVRVYPGGLGSSFAVSELRQVMVMLDQLRASNAGEPGVEFGAGAKWR